MAFKWDNAISTLEGFGGESITLHIPKTGLPFYDALRLYGAIDLYVGLREDVDITDAGNEWKVEGRCRKSRLEGKDEAAFRQTWTKKKPNPEEYCKSLRSSLSNGKSFHEEYHVPATKALTGVDAALQAGIRDISALKYETLQSGQTSESTCCVARVPLSDGILAFAGKKRTEGVGNIVFLPIFDGRIDMSKVVSPLRAWIGVPNVLCAQALILLALKTSLFAEGYQDRLSAVVFNTSYDSRTNINYAGVITISSTAIGRMDSEDFIAHAYRILRILVSKAWNKGQSTKFTPHALSSAYWLLQPVGRHLSEMITSQELLHREGLPHMFSKGHAKEVFNMTYGNWQGDYDSVRKFAKAVASGIYNARMRREQNHEDRRKAWYDEVSVLRSSPSAKAFIGRAMILIEQGHREHSQVGTTHRQEDFNPPALLDSIGADRSSFETFRDLFRMYLVQESTYTAKEEPAEEDAGSDTNEENSETEQGTEG